MPRHNKAVRQLGRRARYDFLQNVRRRAQGRDDPDDNADRNERNVGRQDANENIAEQEQEQQVSGESDLDEAANHDHVARPLQNIREAVQVDPVHVVVPAQDGHYQSDSGSSDSDFDADNESGSDTNDSDDSDHDANEGRGFDEINADEENEASDNDEINDALGEDINDINNDGDDDSDGDREPANADGGDIGFRPLYRGAHITVSESVSAVLKFLIDHSLDSSTVGDLFQLIQLHCPQEGLVKLSLYKLKNYFSFSSGPVKKNYYCSVCKQHLDSPQHVCPICERRRGVSTFIQTPIIPQLKEMLSRPNFYHSLQNRFYRQRINEGCLEDIYDGAVYREQVNFLSMPNNFSMTYFVDGVPVFKSKKFSFWGFYLTINELPYEERVKRSNTLLAGIWLGQKPEANLFMSSFLDDFRRLLDGVNLYVEDMGRRVLMKGMVIAGVADTPARSTFLNNVHHNGFYGCPLCEIVGESVRLPTGSDTHSYRYVQHLENRTVERNFNYARHAIERGDAVRGIKGPTILRLFMPNYLRGTGIDVMHLVQGIMKKMLALHFGSKYSTFHFSLRAMLDVANNLLLSIKPPKFIHRFPRKLDEFTHAKASELLAWFFYYSVVVLKPLLRPELYDHYLKLVIGLSYLNAPSVSDQMINTANQLLHEFVRDFEIMYGSRFCSINIHMLLHLSKCTSELGPMQKFSCFPYEHINGQILRDIHGKTNVDSQITRMHWQTLKLPNRFRNLREGPVKDYCLKRHGQLKITERVQEKCYVVGRYLVREVNDPLIALGFQNSNLQFRRVKPYTRLLKKDLLYVSEKYIRDLRSNSSCAAFYWGGTKVYGCVHIFVKALQCECDFGCNCEGEHFAIIKCTEKIGEMRLLEHQNVSLQYMHEARMTMHFLAVPIRNLITVCFNMNVANTMYIAEPVNDSKNE